MIITHTSNPSIDYYLELDDDFSHGIHRASSTAYLAGGKGLNVSMILNQMGIESVATTFLGGFSGTFICEQIKKYPYIHLEGIQIAEANRINIKIRGQKEIDINSPGPKIPICSQKRVLEKLKDLKKDDWVMICGSLAQDVSEQFLVDIASLVHKKQANLVFDIPGIKAKLLQQCQPNLIKPNVEELYNMFDLKLGCGIETKVLINRLLNMNVSSVLLSKGSYGAEFHIVQSSWKVSHPMLKAVSTVGSGDSMLAAFVGQLNQKKSIEEALTWAAAAGEATAVSLGLANYDKIVQMVDNVEISRE